MTVFLNLGGSERPAYFDYELAMQYEVSTQRKFLKDMLQLQQELSAGAAKMNKDNPDETDLSEVAVEVSVLLLSNFAYTAMMNYCRQNKQPVDFDVFKVSGWLMENPNESRVIVEALFGMLPKANGEVSGPDDTKKRKFRQHRLGGTA